MRLLHPQELESLYLLPAVRRAFAIESLRMGVHQKKIAELLGITPAAVTNYIKSKRATGTKLDESTLKSVEKLSKTAKTPKDVKAGTQKILLDSWKKRQVCSICHNINKTKNSCNECFDFSGRWN
ncbi:hypothetical protein HY483_03940 [Candidatus Woesearchaeota archaeon]|nr:hypothetical protein [Candidatus Woesearchaeota archaeon]